ncbi:MDR family MFS transporter [Ornithinibacillus bavariensis]|uniref:Multidrug resistance protein n=1 Tax=Ornithinibacillus bavariensis TaxID=545502 RepID=A0A919X864_9BACI|nr:MFS transporter [Ornithinibacillus bavariensis]GIO26310.1 multidrug resistance protein [Ornithinibacillus bavariensis]
MKWLSWDINLKTRLIGETLFNMLFWMYFPFLTIYFSDELGVVEAGIMMTAPSIISIFGGMIGGYVTDQFGRRKIMLVGAFMQAAFFALFALSFSPWFDYVAFIGISLGKSFYRPASTAMVADLVPDEERRSVFATFASANNLGAVLGPIIGAVLFFQYRSELLWACTVVTLLYSIAILYIIRETMPEHEEEDAESKTLLLLVKQQFVNYCEILKDRVFFFYILGGIFITVSIMQLDLYLAIYVRNFVPAQELFSIGEWSVALSSEEVFGWMIGLNGLLFVLCVIPVTKMLDSWSDRNSLILSACLSGIGMFLVGFTTSAWLLFGITVILTIGEIIHGPVVQNFVSKYAPKHARGQYMGASDLQYSLGRLIAPFTVILSVSLSPVLIFGFIMVCALISAIIYVFVFKILPENYTANNKNRDF